MCVAHSVVCLFFLHSSDFLKASRTFKKKFMCSYSYQELTELLCINWWMLVKIVTEF